MGHGGEACRLTPRSRRAWELRALCGGLCLALHERLHRTRERQDSLRQPRYAIPGERDTRSVDEHVSERSAERRRAALRCRPGGPKLLRTQLRANGPDRHPGLDAAHDGDAAIPFAHESLFAAAVADAGRSDLLVQRPIHSWGHCAFTAEEVQTAFSDLVQWVTTGQRP